MKEVNSINWVAHNKRTGFSEVCQLWDFFSREVGVLSVLGLPWMTTDLQVHFESLGFEKFENFQLLAVHRHAIIHKEQHKIQCKVFSLVSNPII